MVSIREIAKKSGYSASTVSRYLNQSGYVSPAAAEKIQAVIAAADYVPSQLARDLSSGRSRRIGVVIPHTRHPYFIGIIRGLLEVSQASQYQILLLPSDYQQDLELSYLEQLRAKVCDALIFTSRSLALETIASYTKYGQIVCLEDVGNSALSSVYVDRSSGYRALFAWLEAKKPKCCALLFTRNDDTSFTYRQTLQFARDYLVGTDLKTYGGLSNETDSGSILPYLFQDHQLDCIVANSDNLAVRIQQAYNRDGRPLPLIVSQDSQLSGQLFQIPSIDNHAYELGKKAFAIALSAEVQQLTIQSHFMEKR